MEGDSASDRARAHEKDCGNVASAIEFMFHPTFFTSDRDRFAAWLQRVFRRNGTFQREFMSDMGGNVDYPSDYSFYMMMSDVYLDVIDPDLFRLPGAPATLKPPLDRLSELGWSVLDPNKVYRSARKHGLRVHDQLGREVVGDTIPLNTSPLDPDLVFTWLDPRDAGLSVELATPPPPCDGITPRGCSPASPTTGNILRSP